MARCRERLAVQGAVRLRTMRRSRAGVCFPRAHPLERPSRPHRRVQPLNQAFRRRRYRPASARIAQFIESSGQPACGRITDRYWVRPDLDRCISPQASSASTWVRWAWECAWAPIPCSSAWAARAGSQVVTRFARGFTTTAPQVLGGDRRVAVCARRRGGAWPRGTRFAAGCPRQWTPLRLPTAGDARRRPPHKGTGTQGAATTGGNRPRRTGSPRRALSWPCIRARSATPRRRRRRGGRTGSACPLRLAASDFDRGDRFRESPIAPAIPSG